MSDSSTPLQRRQYLVPLDNEDVIYDGDGWYSTNGYIIKWSIIGAIILSFVLFLVLGYFHAQRRMKKGLRPLAYHRWLVPRSQRMRFDPTYQNQYMVYPMNREQDGYAMNGYAPPPPVYDRNNENAPTYLPPEGASKVNPDQGDYAAIPPPGAPPLRNDDAPAYPGAVAGSSARQQV
ncbi:hypothetical protein GJ744_004664 [Endocarpon pusillum]|uniref:Ubiquitin-protein ligase sel1 n=1 Tax=Endocarpon pusillum TaxID=364733 RepID=A0A8H7AUQ4_9EURO|nr:hypothetical protein GJ744_004664 [Endocarpon pusillum]